MAAVGGPIHWVQQLRKIGNKDIKRQNLGVLFAFWWQIWKEMNRRIFNNKVQSVPQLANLIKDEIGLFSLAMTTSSLDQGMVSSVMVGYPF